MKTSIEEFWAIYNREAKKAGMGLGTYPPLPRLIRISKRNRFKEYDTICPVCFVANIINPNRAYVNSTLSWHLAAEEIGLDLDFAQEIANSADLKGIYRERLLEPLK